MLNQFEWNILIISMSIATLCDSCCGAQLPPPPLQTQQQPQMNPGQMPYIGRQLFHPPERPNYETISQQMNLRHSGANVDVQAEHSQHESMNTVINTTTKAQHHDVELEELKHHVKELTDIQRRLLEQLQQDRHEQHTQNDDDFNLGDPNDNPQHQFHEEPPYAENYELYGNYGGDGYYQQNKDYYNNNDYGNSYNNQQPNQQKRRPMKQRPFQKVKPTVTPINSLTTLPTITLQPTKSTKTRPNKKNKRRYKPKPHHHQIIKVKPHKKQIVHLKKAIFSAIWTGVVVAAVKLAPLLLIAVKLIIQSIVGTEHHHVKHSKKHHEHEYYDVDHHYRSADRFDDSMEFDADDEESSLEDHLESEFDDQFN